MTLFVMHRSWGTWIHVQQNNKFLKKKDFISLGVQVPTGHRRLTSLNAVEKLQTPITRKMLSIEIPETVRNKPRLDKSRKLKLFPETEDKQKAT